MWPKALLELAPHLVRLVPAANRFFQDKASGEDADHKAMEAMAEGLRGDLGQVTAAHAGLYRQLNEQSEALAGIKASVEEARLTAASAEGRVARLQRRAALNTKLLAAVLVLNFALVLLVIVLLVRH
jgi:phage-related tail protein